MNIVKHLINPKDVAIESMLHTNSSIGVLEPVYERAVVTRNMTKWWYAVKFKARRWEGEKNLVQNYWMPRNVKCQVWDEK